MNDDRSRGIRNTGSARGDDMDEMPAHERLDEATADVVLTGRAPEGDDGQDLADLVALIAAIRSEREAPVRPTAELEQLLTGGISTADQPATAGTNVHGPARQASGLPKWRMKRMLELLTAKLAAMSVIAKAGVAGAAVVAATTGAGAAGALPDAVQDRVAATVGAVTPFEFPTSADDETDEVEVVEVDDERPGVDGPEIARDASDPEDPGVDGRDVADDASDGRSEEGRERADEAGERAEEGRERAEEARETADEWIPGAADERRQEGRSRSEDASDEPAGELQRERGEQERNERAEQTPPAETPVERGEAPEAPEPPEDPGEGVERP